ncbi:MAG: DMT family transporter [Chloroflexota bacterium]
MSLQAIPYIVLLSFLFGSTLIASRFSVGQFHPTTYSGLRLALAGLSHITLYLIGYQRRRWPTDLRLWGHAALLGVLGTAVPMTSIVSSLQYQSAGLTAVLLTTGPAITVLMAHFFLADESLTWRKSLGIALALGGAVLLAVRGENGLPDLAQVSPIGYGLVLLAMVFGSAMTIYARRYMREFDAFDVASVRMLAAAVTVMPLSLLWVGFDLHRVNGQGYFALGYAAVAGTFFGMLVAFYNIKRFGATASAMSDYVIPVVAGLGGVLILGEQITGSMLVGMGLIAAGIALINRV